MAALWLSLSLCPSQQLSKAWQRRPLIQFANWIVKSISPCSGALEGAHSAPGGLHHTLASRYSTGHPAYSIFPRVISCPSPAAPWGIPPYPYPSVNPTLPSVFLTNPVLLPSSASSQSCAATSLCFQPILYYHPYFQPIPCCLPRDI